MGARVKTAAVVGVDAVVVEAEAEVNFALRRFSLVGLPDGVVKEAKDRVRCAIQSSGFEFPPGEVIVSLAPAWLPKLGSGFDLAIAVAIIAAVGLVPRTALDRVIVLGELSLDGSVRPARGALQAAVAAARLAQREQSAPFKLIVSADGSDESACIGGVDTVPVSSLLEAITYLRGETEITSPVFQQQTGPDWSGPTFADVIGQNEAKRALQVCAAGGHNILLVGPPGAGKSMLAARFPALLPPLSLDDSIEVTKIASAAECDDAAFGRPAHGRTTARRGLICRRPFRAPHHSASVAGIVGGGPLALPGEVTLAHRGVLFLDELSEFRREVLESLRQPLEARKVVISRARLRITYPSDFQLIAAMNPCPCGRRGIPGGGCQCGVQAIQSFQRRLSGPILDRIDLQVWVPPVPPAELVAGVQEDSTAALIDGIKTGRRIQIDRFQSDSRLNSSMTSTEIKRWCRLDDRCKRVIEKAAAKKMLSARAVSRTIKTARTIADIDGTADIAPNHLAEALRYRMKEIGVDPDC